MCKQYPSVEASQMFGKPCLKAAGKAFCCFYDGDMVFKLAGLDYQKGLALKGSKQFDPAGSGKPMKEWVQIYISQADKWQRFAVAAMEYVEHGIIKEDI